MKSYVLAACILALPCRPVAADPYLFGRLGARLAPGDIAAISRVTQDVASAPWALFGRYSQVLPEVRYVDAFVRPGLATNRIRRGPLVHLECRPRADAPECLPWEIQGAPGEYVQLADGADFGESLDVRRDSERPIRVTGSFSDSELISLVAFIRSKPSVRAPKGMVGMQLGSDYPIMDICRVDDGSVSVTLSPDGGIGETGTVTRTRHGWELTRVTMWVA
jgi:hypothetical protein